MYFVELSQNNTTPTTNKKPKKVVRIKVINKYHEVHEATQLAYDWNLNDRIGIYVWVWNWAWVSKLYLNNIDDCCTVEKWFYALKY